MQKDKKTIFIIASIFIAAILVGWLFAKYIHTKNNGLPKREAAVKNESAAPVQPEGDAEAIKIFYPSGEGISVEEKMIKKSLLSVVFAQNIISEYLKGLKFETEIRLINVYRDRNNVIYIDISDGFRRGFSGDAKQEYYLLKSIFETVYRNVPDVEDVRLFIEGREIESIGGHFYSLYGLKTIFLNDSAVNANEQ